jgi:hypothetical protein
MADRSVVIDADDVIENLDIIRRVQMPFVASWALNQLGPRIRRLHQQEMQRTFENPVPFTTNSVRWGAKGYKPWVRSDKNNLEMGIWISEDGAKGQDPAVYLFPQVSEGTGGGGSKQVYVTRFTKRLRREGQIGGNQYLLPLKKSSNVISDLLNSYGNITPGQYNRILFALGAMEFPLRGYAKKGRVKDSIFIAPNLGTGRQRGLRPGIYRRKGDQFGMLFKTLPSPPSVRPKYYFYEATEDWATDYFPQYVEQKLGEIFGR